MMLGLSGCVSYVDLMKKESDIVKEDVKKENTVEEKADEEKNEVKGQPEITGENLLEDMSAEERRKLNTFLSNFSESFYGISTTDCVEEDKIRFAYIHNLYNVEGFEPYINRMERGILAEEVDATLEK